MANQENKICPRCKNTFGCQPNNITQCQCAQVTFSTAQLQFIGVNYSDCLCAACLQELGKRYSLQNGSAQ